MSTYYSSFGYGTSKWHSSGVSDVSSMWFSSDVSETYINIRLPGGCLAWVSRKPGGNSSVNACLVRQTVESRIASDGPYSESRIDSYSSPAPTNSSPWSTPFSPAVSVSVDSVKNPKIAALAGNLEMFSSDGNYVSEFGIPSEQFDRATSVRSSVSAGGSVVATCMHLSNGDVAYDETELDGSSSSSSADVRPRAMFLLTDAGMFYTTTEFPTAVPAPFSHPCSTPCQTADVRTPCFWFNDLSAKEWRLFDPSAMVVKPSVSVASGAYVRSVQFDQMTGDAFFLVPFGIGGSYATVTRYSYSSNAAADFVLSIGGNVVNVGYALDMKIDSARRRIWILDSGRNQVFRANLDTGYVDRTYAPTGMLCPCSMVIDETTGTAYVRAMNGAILDEGQSSSSSSSSGGPTAEASSRETIYAADDSAMIPIIGVDGSTSYPYSVLNPTPSDVDAMIASGNPIPLPGSKSMRFDHLRRRLWWLSKKEDAIIHMANVLDYTFQSLSLTGGLDSVASMEIDQEAGTALACGSYYDMGVVVSVDSSCSTATVVTGVPVSGWINDLVLIGTELGNVVPFYCSTVEMPGQLHDSSSSSQGEETVHVESIDNSYVAEQVAASFTTSVPIVDVRIWGGDYPGSSLTRSWAIKGANPSPKAQGRTMQLPTFSWSTNVISGNPAMAVMDGYGNLLEAAYDPKAKTVSIVGSTVHPFTGSTGVSTNNGDGNVYVSNQGSLSKACFDLTTPGVATNSVTSGSESSSSSSSSQSAVKAVRSFPILVSESTGDTGIGGISVQFHDESQTVWAVSPQEGSLVSFDGANGLAIIKEYGPLPMPFKAVWSSVHGGAVVACRNVVSIVNAASGGKKTAYGAPGYEVLDVCEDSGNVGIALASPDRGDGLFKVVAPNLSSNLLSYRTSGEFPSKACFVSTGKVLVAIERSVGGSQVTRFVSMGIGETPGTSSQDMPGSVNSMFFDDNFGMTFAAFSSGTIVVVSQESSGTSTATKVGTIHGGIRAASGSLVQGVASVTPSQSAVRVFVGSTEGASDRWDSGVVETTAQTMPYGGGDDLIPGEAYWLSVAVMDAVGGWSTPSSKRFVVPMI